MEKLEVSIKCRECGEYIKEINDENSEMVTTYDVCVYCPCGNEILYTIKK